MGSILSKMKRIKKQAHDDYIVLDNYNENSDKKEEVITIFRKPLGYKYADMIYNIYNSDIETRNEKMHNLYETINKDHFLTPYQLRLLKRVIFLYKYAVCLRGQYINPLIDYALKHTAYIKKNFSDVRYRREIRNISTITMMFGDMYDISTLKFKISELVRNYTVLNKEKDEDLIDRISTTFITTLSLFCRKLNKMNTEFIWFVSMLLKNLDNIIYINLQMLKENEDLKKQISKFVQSIVWIDKIINDKSHLNKTIESEMNNNELQLQQT